MQLANANPAAQVSGADQLPGHANYFLGNDPAKWHTNVPTYSKVKYTNVYDGIDLVYYGNQRQLEYDFIVAPGHNPNQIQLHFAGAQKLKLDPNGDLEVIAKNGQIAFHKPVVYQTADGSRRPVEGQFTLASNNTVSFALGRYDLSEPLVIDPVLAYSTYLGGTGNGIDEGLAITVDASGSAYLTGDTSSNTFPVTTGAFQATASGNNVVFITKLSADGKSLVYSTYLGGNQGDYGRAIKVDLSGDVYVAGFTYSGNFPVTSRAYQTFNGSNTGDGGFDAFLTKLNPAGSELIFSTFPGPTVSVFGTATAATGIAIDASGDAYMAGYTNATANFPTTSGAYQTTNNNQNGGTNVFVARFSSDGSELPYLTSLLSGYKSNNINWLPISPKSLSESDV